MHRAMARLGLAAVIGLGIHLVGAPLARAESAPATTEGGAAFPDTPTGRCARAFVEVWNTGSLESRAAFERDFASASRLASSDAQTRAARMASLRDRFGEIVIERIASAPDGTVTVHTVGAGGSPLAFEFKMSADAPDRLDAVMIAAGAPGGAESITPELRAETVRGVASAMESGYVFPEVGAAMAQSLRTHLDAGAYDDAETAGDLAMRLTRDLRAVSNDGHIAVRPTAPAPRVPGDDPFDAEDDLAGGNYGFRKVEILDGNIGYVRLDGFVPGEDAERTAAAAMAFIAHCDALIFDLRFNGGGSPEMIRFLTSYLFDEPTHLNDMVDRSGEVVGEFWTLAEVPGTRIGPEVPVYVLTSSYTFSGAEEFSYNLQNLERAVIIGEQTGGGAHPVRGERVNDQFTVGVPFMRARNPISGTNWEGTGVAPDVATSADDALGRAQTLARQAAGSR